MRSQYFARFRCEGRTSGRMARVPVRLWHRNHQQCRSPRFDQEARSADLAARFYREGAGRAEPLEHRAHRRMGACEAKLVVEVRYDHVTGGRFRHRTKLLRFGPDKAPRQCTFEQIGPAMPLKSIEQLLK